MTGYDGVLEAMACVRAVVALLVVAFGVTLVKGDLAVMTDVTLGFGQALEHCRAEVSLAHKYIPLDPSRPEASD